jgi:hypothetical protein
MDRRRPAWARDQAERVASRIGVYMVGKPPSPELEDLELPDTEVVDHYVQMELLWV